MSPLSTRVNIEKDPYRKVRPTTSKIVFISCEGSVTEEEYFRMISNIFDKIKSKIQFISVREDIIITLKHLRTEGQVKELGKSQPRQLMEKIDRFKFEKQSIFDFEKHPEDEFWIILDVDHHTKIDVIEEWNSILDMCDEKSYGYVVSNPFFELWLCLHHFDVVNEDYNYAVTDEHPYEPTSYYRERLGEANAALLGRNKKNISANHYSENKIRQAIQRAKNLHIDKKEKWPHNLGSTVYLLLEKIVEMV